MEWTCLRPSAAFALAILGYGGNALAVDCFIDSAGGNDTNSGLAEDQPVKTQAKIPKSCTVAKYKRGSQFAEKVAIGGSVKTYTNYGDPCDPMPRFVMPGTANTGAVLSAYQGGITVDGLYLANSHGDGSSSGANFGKGTCVTLGSNSVMQNCEITSCDIGVMVSGTGSKFLNNYVHDLNTMIADAPQSSGVNINTVGGAEAIFINGSNNEVAYNQFINCTGTSEWTGGSCDGGATEVAIGNNSTVSGVKIHHNFAYNTCGFFEVSSGTQGGTFADSEFYNNVSVDSGWMFLLQINNTALSNVRWENNTIVYHKSGDSSYAPVVSMIYNGTGTSGAGNAKMGTVAPNTVFFNNNLVLFAGFKSPSTLDSNISQSNNLITATTAGVVKNLGTSGTTPSPADFDLVDGSPAIDQGKAIASVTVDFLNRAVPTGATADIGAFEYGASLASGRSTPIATMDIVTGKVNGGCAPAGDTSGGSTGASDASGGSTSTSGASNPATSDPSTTSTPVATGGTGSGTPASKTATGGKSATPARSATGERTATPASNPGAGGNAGASSLGPSNGVQTSPYTTVSASQAGPSGGAGPAVGGSTSVENTIVEDSGCNCRSAGRSPAPNGAGLLGILVAATLARRRRRLWASR